MILSKTVGEMLGWIDKGDDFVVGKDNFSDLEISQSPQQDNFSYFFHKKDRRLIKRFLLDSKPEVDYLCEVILIKKGDKFTPRITFVNRDKKKRIVQIVENKPTNIKARVSLDDCQENFWKVIHYIDTLKEVDKPREKFSLMSESESDIISAFQGRDSQSIVEIIKGLSSNSDIKLTQEEINQLLKRRDKLDKFKNALDRPITDEAKWQTFFENNKWIFGYGLNYQILNHEQAQPNYGGTRMDGKGGQRGDYLTSTVGDINFTVLVEIKTPVTPLLQGTKEIRNGAWSLSRELGDAISQIQANMARWDKEGSTQADNRDELESRDVYTVKPKGILVIGSLQELDSRSKRETFQRFRASIHDVDILTFDELYNRAKFIVDHKDE